MTDPAEGLLVYFKASLSGDEKDYVIVYKLRNPAFPHETTGDQFFSEEQFEVYRALGYHMASGFMDGTDKFACQTDHRSRPIVDSLRNLVRSLLV